MLEKRKLGSSDIEVPAITLGGNVFGWTVGEQQAFGLLDRAVDLGLNSIDTANVYSKWAPGNQGGESETIIGKWLARSGRRKDVVLATKVGWDMGDGHKGLRASYIERAAEESLRRLQTDYIDVYFAHIDDAETPLEETLGAFDKLVKAGKVRTIGASNYKAPRLREALETSKRKNLARYQVLQPLYNLLERHEYERELAPVAQEYKIGVSAYYGLASGFLSGKYRTQADLKDKARGGGVKKYMNERGFTVIAALEEVAREHNASPASVALAWLAQRPTITSAIASATSERQVEDLAAAARLKLDHASMERLTNASNPVSSAA